MTASPTPSPGMDPTQRSRQNAPRRGQSNSRLYRGPGRIPAGTENHSPNVEPPPALFQLPNLTGETDGVTTAVASWDKTSGQEGRGADSRMEPNVDVGAQSASSISIDRVVAPTTGHRTAAVGRNQSAAEQSQLQSGRPYQHDTEHEPEEVESQRPLGHPAQPDGPSIGSGSSAENDEVGDDFETRDQHERLDTWLARMIMVSLLVMIVTFAALAVRGLRRSSQVADSSTGQNNSELDVAQSDAENAAENVGNYALEAYSRRSGRDGSQESPPASELASGESGSTPNITDMFDAPLQHSVGQPDREETVDFAAPSSNLAESSMTLGGPQNTAEADLSSSTLQPNRVDSRPSLESSATESQIGETSTLAGAGLGETGFDEPGLDSETLPHLPDGFEADVAFDDEFFDIADAPSDHQASSESLQNVNAMGEDSAAGITASPVGIADSMREALVSTPPTEQPIATVPALAGQIAPANPAQMGASSNDPSVAYRYSRTPLAVGDWSQYFYPDEAYVASGPSEIERQ